MTITDYCRACLGQWRPFNAWSPARSVTLHLLHWKASAVATCGIQVVPTFHLLQKCSFYINIPLFTTCTLFSLIFTSTCILPCILPNQFTCKRGCVEMFWGFKWRTVTFHFAWRNYTITMTLHVLKWLFIIDFNDPSTPTVPIVQICFFLFFTAFLSQFSVLLVPFLKLFRGFFQEFCALGQSTKLWPRAEVCARSELRGKIAGKKRPNWATNTQQKIPWNHKKNFQNSTKSNFKNQKKNKSPTKSFQNSRK